VHDCQPGRRGFAKAIAREHRVFGEVVRAQRIRAE
jgi:hypothetical protein